MKLILSIALFAVAIAAAAAITSSDSEYENALDADLEMEDSFVSPGDADLDLEDEDSEDLEIETDRTGSKAPTPSRTSAPATRTASCAAGQFSPAGASKCQPCPPGTTSVPGSTSCSNCPIGTFARDSGSPKCTPCPIGSYSNSNRVTSCKLCDAGWTTLKPGSKFCELIKFACPTGQVWTGSACAKSATTVSKDKCPVNTYFDHTVDKGTCVSCPPGTVYSGTGATSVKQCKPCPAGSATFNGKAGYGCSRCPPGTHAWISGLRECEPCSKGTHAAKSGQKDCTFNTCPLDTYGALDGSVGATKTAPCKPCPPHEPAGDGYFCCSRAEFASTGRFLCPKSKKRFNQ